MSSSIEALRNDISERENMTEMMELPSKEEMELMKDEVAFTGKHLDANQETTFCCSSRRSHLCKR